MSETTISRTLVVKNPQGMHLRPLNQFVKVAMQYESDVSICKNGQRADGRSILEIMTLAIEHGETVELSATGNDAQAALDALAQVVEHGVDEQAGSS